jgi:hypothetical protein
MKILITEEQYKTLTKDDCIASENIKKIYEELDDAASGAATKEPEFVTAVKKIKTAQEYNELNSYISCKGKGNIFQMKFNTLDELILDEFDPEDEDDFLWLMMIDKHFIDVVGLFKNFSTVQVANKKNNTSLTGIDAQVYEAAINKGWSEKAALMLIAQFRHETGDYTSNVFKCNNNLGGMVFIKNNPLIKSRGRIKPPNELSKNGCKRKYPFKNYPDACFDPGNGKCVDDDFYAHYESIEDSIKDKLGRYFEFTKNGVTPDMLKQAESVNVYATLLKKRNYYTDTAANYASNMNAKLKKMGLTV